MNVPFPLAATGGHRAALQLGHCGDMILEGDKKDGKRRGHKMKEGKEERKERKPEGREYSGRTVKLLQSKGL